MLSYARGAILNLNLTRGNEEDRQECLSYAWRAISNVNLTRGNEEDSRECPSYAFGLSYR
jgi:hypothetical protein